MDFTNYIAVVIISVLLGFFVGAVILDPPNKGNYYTPNDIIYVEDVGLIYQNIKSENSLIDITIHVRDFTEILRYLSDPCDSAEYQIKIRELNFKYH